MGLFFLITVVYVTQFFDESITCTLSTNGGCIGNLNTKLTKRFLVSESAIILSAFQTSRYTAAPSMIINMHIY